MRYFVGDDWTIVYELEDDNGQPLDVTSATARWRLYRLGSAPVVDVSATTLPNGRVEVMVPKNTTSTISAGIYTCDLLIDFSPTNRRTFAQMTITIQERP